MSNIEQVIATMLILGLVVGFCGGALFGLWYAERTQKRERMDRMEIGELVKNARAKTFAQSVCDDIDEAKRRKDQSNASIGFFLDEMDKKQQRTRP